MRWTSCIALFGALTSLAACSATREEGSTSTSNSISDRCTSAEADLFGINIDPTNPWADPSSDELHELGARWVRVEYKAEQGAAFYRDKLATLRAGRIKVLLLVDYAALPGYPAPEAPAAEWARYRGAFAHTAMTIAKDIGGDVDAWEIWNEPDGVDWTVPAHELGPMLVAAADAIRKYSSAPLVVGGLSSGDVGFLRNTIAAAGGSLPYEAVGIHPYGKVPDGMDPSKVSWNTGDLSAMYAEFYGVARKPLWVTEFGTNDEHVQPEYVQRFYEVTRDGWASRVPVVLQFTWSDAQRPGEHLGLHFADKRKKPAFETYASLSPAGHAACRE